MRPQRKALSSLNNVSILKNNSSYFKYVSDYDKKVITSCPC